MSTNARPWKGTARATALGVALLLPACAQTVPAPDHGFAEVRFAHPAPPSEPAYLRPRPAPLAPSAPSQARPDLQLATTRVLALLAQDGFTAELRREGAAEIVSATRMGAPGALSREAVCALKAMRRPDFSSSQLTVRLVAVPGGVAATTAGVSCSSTST